MLHELLKIKNIRKQSADDDVRKCKNRLEVAQQEVQTKQQEFDDYVDWRCKEEQRLYDNIINMEIRQKDLDHLKKKIALLREKDVTLEQAVNEAEKKVTEEKQALETARDVLTKAMQAVEKFEEFTRVLDEESAKEAERIEDLEMEEFTVRPKF